MGGVKCRSARGQFLRADREKHGAGPGTEAPPCVDSLHLQYYDHGVYVHSSRITDFGKILGLSAPDIGRITQLSIIDIHALYQAVSEAVPKIPPVTALDLSNGTVPEKLIIAKLSTGCPILDHFLRGGILTRGITEIAGESASGKTQLCMQLSLVVQLPPHLGGLGSGALYICTEDVFPNKRLLQMADLFKRNQTDPAIRGINFTDNIYIEHTAELSDLEFCLNRKAPILLARGAAKLVIVDSIAALFRCEFGAQDAVKRAKVLSSLCTQLLNLSHQHNVSIICVNQVSDSFSNTPNLTGGGGARSKFVPTLGLAWSHLIKVRLLLSRTQQSIPVTCKDRNGKLLSTQSVLRNMDILFAPHLSDSTCNYIIDSEGVKGVS